MWITRHGDRLLLNRFRTVSSDPWTYEEGRPDPSRSAALFDHNTQASVAGLDEEDNMSMSHLDGALAWYGAGMSVVPVVADGSKRPMGTWTKYQHEAANELQVRKWWRITPEQGVGIICGRVSGNLEMLEVEAARMDSTSWDRIRDAIDAQGDEIADLWASLTEVGYCESTPSGGIHILYRVQDVPVPGNTKIAMDPTGKITYAETRGEGGFVVVAPSGGKVHKSGDSWSVLAGEIGAVPMITWEQRCAIHKAIQAALDERTIPTYERPAGTTYDRQASGDRPGDAFNDDPSVTVHDILTRNGWKYLGTYRGQERYVHPHSSDMSTHSACTGHKGSPNLYAWSGLPKEGSYTKFALLAELEFNGDYSAASRFLHSRGYGEQRGGIDISDWFTAADEGTGMETVVDDTTTAVAGPEEVKTPKVKKFTEWTETGAGELMAAVYGDRFRFVGDRKAWRRYEKGLWFKDETNEVGQAGKRVTSRILAQAFEDLMEAEGDEAEKVAKANIRKAEAFRSDRGSKAIVSRFSNEKGVTVPSTAFDGNVNLLRFENGTLDLSTMVLREHRPDDMISLNIPYAYDPSATAPMFDKFLNDSMPDQEMRSYLQRAAGYAASGRPNADAWFVLFGDTACGKSTFLRIVQKALGEHARTAAQQTFAQRNEGSRAMNDLNDIRSARMVVISETKEGQLFNEALIKQYSGGDEMNSHGLYEENATWENRGVLFLATNHPPRLSADDNANWRRVKMIEFPISWEGHPDADPFLDDKIIANELAGVMNWIIAGLVAYRAEGLNDPKQVQEMVKGHRVDVDPVSQFLNEGSADGYIVIGEGQEIGSSQIYVIFNQWCRDNGITAIGNRRFGMRLTAMGYGQRKGGKGVRIRTGIGQGSRGAAGTMPVAW